METNITLKENETIEINGAVINKTCADHLKNFQDSDNSIIKGMQKDIADATEIILLAMDYVNDDYAKCMLANIKELNLTRRNLIYFMKPKQA